MNLDEAIEFHRARLRKNPPPPPSPQQAAVVKAVLGLVPKVRGAQEGDHEQHG